MKEYDDGFGGFGYDYDYGYEEPLKPQKKQELPEKKTRKVRASYSLNEIKELWNNHMNEAAIGPNELPDDVNIAVKITPKKEMALVLVDDKRRPYKKKEGDPIYGVMWLEYAKECGGYIMQWVNASQGFGPLLYDVAMELAAEHNSWIMSDRNAVSAEAQKVWEYYDQYRDDVEKKAIGLEKDCSFRSAIKAVKEYELDREQYGMKPPYIDWEKHPLAFKWRKPQTDIISVLKSSGKYFDLDTHPSKTLGENINKNFVNKYKMVNFEYPLSKEQFIYFTTSERAKQIIESKKITLSKPYEEYYTDTIDAVSMTYGEFNPKIQISQLPQNEGQILAIKFKTKHKPHIGLVEQVSWVEDIEIEKPKILTLERAKTLLLNTTENKRVNQHEWAYVRYSNE